MIKRVSRTLVIAVLCWTLVPTSPVRMVDGDTFDATIEIWLGFGNRSILAPERIRVLGVNTPEKGQPGYEEAAAFTANWLGLAAGQTPVKIKLDNVCKRDSFGRVLADVKRDSDGHGLGADLLAAGLAKPYP